MTPSYTYLTVSLTHPEKITSENLAELYCDWMNNYLSVARFTQKVLAAELHQSVVECHAVVSHRFVPVKIIVLITITLPDKPMALTILPNLHHVPGLYYDWGSYAREVPKARHLTGKIFTQRIESNNLTLRTRIKRLARKTICFSRSIEIHEKVIGSFIEKYMFY